MTFSVENRVEPLSRSSPDISKGKQNMLKNLGVIIALLLSVGVITIILVILMVPSFSSTNSDELPANGMEGEYTYAEIPDFGKMKGKKLSNEAAAFYGIPYTQPPKGEFRWAKPRQWLPLEHDGEYYDATFPRSGCPQNCILPSPKYTCPQEIDEDCLHLAVHLPSRLTKEIRTTEGSYYILTDDITSANLPVMFFIHGGAFLAGAGAVDLYDGRFFVQKGDVIAVTINYRLGPFGFFYQDSGDSDAVLGNYGILDQREALKWVQSFIRYLGGDPQEVTIFGQSAGGQSISVHLISEESKPLFKRAILQSNPFGLNLKTTEEAQDMCNKFVQWISTNTTNEEYNCGTNDVNCLRNIPMEDILKHLKTFPITDQLNRNSLTQLFEPWAPIFDKVLLEKHPFYYFKERAIQDKPLMFGFTEDEGAYFVAQVLSSSLKSNKSYNFFVKLLFGTNDTKVIEKYPPECSEPSLSCDNRKTIDDWVTDYLFTCPSRNAFSTDSTFGDKNLPVWWYHLRQPWSFPEFWEEYEICYELTCHAAELPYLFDVDKLTEFRFTKPEQELAEKLIFYWTNFAKYGTPNSPANAKSPLTRAMMHSSQGKAPSSEPAYWPRIYEGSSGSNPVYKTLLISDSDKEGERVVDNFKKDLCNFWDELNFYLKDSIKIREGLEPDLPEAKDLLQNILKDGKWQKLIDEIQNYTQ